MHSPKIIHIIGCIAVLFIYYNVCLQNSSHVLGSFCGANCFVPLLCDLNIADYSCDGLFTRMRRTDSPHSTLGNYQLASDRPGRSLHS